MPIVIRRADASDWPAIVELNDAEVPKVGPLATGDRDWYLAHADVTVVDAARDGAREVVGLLVVMVEGCDYPSPNYRWFAERHERFAYVDRIVVRPTHAGAGIGRRLYERAAEHARAHGAPVLTAEVNVDPPNEPSLAFHAALGFDRVGTQVDPRHGTTVAMLALTLD